MKAAVLHTIGAVPQYEDFPGLVPGDGEVLVQIRAASLKNIDKMIANGLHYSDAGTLPAVCGVDGVGTLPDGSRVYFGGVRHPYGTMAEWGVINPAWSFPLPDTLDDPTAAALPNPAISAWLSLIWRARLQPGETVLILGATGVAGKLAVQLAKRLGAGRVVAAGRNAATLQTLSASGADATISLDRPVAELTTVFTAEFAQQHCDVVIDFLWGQPAEAVIAAVTGHDVHGEAAPIRYVQVGEMAGPTIALPAAALRSSALELYGSGGGSVPRKVIAEALAKVIGLAASGQLSVEVEAVPLADVANAWQREDSGGRRLVFVP